MLIAGYLADFPRRPGRSSSPRRDDLDDGVGGGTALLALMA